MAKKKTGKRKTSTGSTAKRKHTKRKAKPKSILDKLKHWLEKRGQGLPMTTIVIIVIVLIVLAVVIVFFFGQFTQGQSTASEQQALGLSATQSAQCTAWANGLIPSLPFDCDLCPADTICTAMKNNVAGLNNCVDPGTCD